jgi:Translation initiation factor eIF3 subunit
VRPVLLTSCDTTDASSDEETSKKVSAPAPAAAAAIGRRRFEDEDAEDEIKDDWEEEDEEKPAPAPAAPTKKKGTVKQKIAEKEAAERRRQELGLEVSSIELANGHRDTDCVCTCRATTKMRTRKILQRGGDKRKRHS